jgi:hypothetical protein
VAALLAQLIADQAMLQTVKKGLGQLGGIAKSSKDATVSLLIGLGIALTDVSNEPLDLPNKRNIYIIQEEGPTEADSKKSTDDNS